MECVCINKRHFQGYDRFSNWRVDVAEIMLVWKEPMVEDHPVIMILPVGENHDPIAVCYSPTKCVWHVVCGLETSIWKHLGI